MAPPPSATIVVSRFSVLAALLALPPLVVVGGGAALWRQVHRSGDPLPVGWAWGMGAFLALPLLLLVLVELRGKLLRFHLTDTKVSYRRWAGLGPRHHRAWSDFRGYWTQEQESDGGSFVVLVLEPHHGSEVCVSEFYMDNFEALAAEVKTRLPSLGVRVRSARRRHHYR